MSRAWLPIGLICGFLSLTSCEKPQQETPTSGKLTVCTAEAYLKLTQAEAQQFDSLYPQATVTVFGATTREAIVNLLNDSVAFVIVDRQLNADERKVEEKAKLQLEEVKIAEDALAVVLNRLNSIEKISQDTLKDILMQKINNWAQIPESKLTGRIETVLTGRNSGAFELLQNYFFNLSEEIKPTVLQATQSAVLHYLAHHPQAIGLISLASTGSLLKQLTTVDSLKSAKVLAISGLDSTGQRAVFKLHQANVYLGRYPLHYPVYIYFNSRRSKLAAGFSAFVASAPGQKIILNWGLVPATMPVRLVQIKE